MTKKPSKKSAKKSADFESDIETINSGSESNGESALQSVKEVEAAETLKGARRGPANESMQYF